MARQYGKVLLTIWRDDEFRSLRGDEQRLYLFLISHPELSAAGTIPFRPTKWAKAAADLSPEAIYAAVDQLEGAGYVIVDHDAEELLVRSFIKVDEGYRSPNMLKALRNAISLIESNRLRARAEHELAAALGEPVEPFADPPRCHPTEPADEVTQPNVEPFAEPFAKPLTEPIPEGMGNNSTQLNRTTQQQRAAEPVLDNEPLPAKTRRSWTDRTDEITRSYRNWYAEQRGHKCPQTHMVLAKIIDRFNDVDRERLTRALAAVPTVSVRSIELELNRTQRPQTVTRIDQRQRFWDTLEAHAATDPTALPAANGVLP